MSGSNAEERAARSYHRWQLGLGAIGVLVTAGYLVTLLMTGSAAHLRDLLAARTHHWWLAVPSAVLILGAGHRLLTVPLSWLGGFWLPRRYGLSHQPLPSWLGDRIKGGVIGIALATTGR